MEDGLMAKGSIANFAYSLRDEAELDSQVLHRTCRNARTPLTWRGVSKCTALRLVQRKRLDTLHL